jgi:hypothetical protein
MKWKMSTQLKFALGILVIGGGALAAEYILVKWYPYYRGYTSNKVLKLLPYHNPELGIDMQVAAGIYGKVDDFPGGVRIYRPRIFGDGPSLTLTSQANPGHTDEFSPQLMAQWETKGTYQNIADYRFEQTKIQNRDAALIWQRRGPALLLTAHIISPDHIVEANCLPGSSDESLYLNACESSIQTIHVEGPEPQLKPEPGVMELQPVKPPKAKPK